MLALTFFYVKPWPAEDKEAAEERKKNRTPEARARDRRDKTIIFSVIGAIILIPLSIWLTVWLWPPVPSANIGMSFVRWEKHYKNSITKTTFDGDNNRYTCSAFEQEVFGIDATVTYYFNRANKLEYIRITSVDGKGFQIEDLLRICSRIERRYRAPDIQKAGRMVWQSRNYELLDLYYRKEIFVIQPRDYYNSEKSFEKAFQLKEYEYT